MPPQNNPNPIVEEQISADGIPNPAAATPAVVPVDEPVVETSSDDTTVPVNEPEIDLTSFLEVKGESPVKKSEDSPAVQATPAEVEKGKEINPSITLKTTPQQQSPALARDLSDLDPDIAPVFKKMSNDAFNTLKPIVKEHKQLKQTVAERDAKIKELEQGIVKVPESYYEHPQAVVLTPEFAQLSNEVQQAQLVFRHWEKQLIDIREGAKDYDFLYQTPEGNWATKKMPADNAAETKVFTYFNFAQQQQMQREAKLNNIVEAHQSKVKEYSQWARNFESTAFPLFETAEGKKTYDPIIQDTLKQLPAVYQKSPVALILAKSLVVNQQLATAYRNLMQQQGNGKPAAATPTANKSKAGPNASETGASVIASAKEDVTLDDFERIKAGV